MNNWKDMYETKINDSGSLSSTEIVAKLNELLDSIRAVESELYTAYNTSQSYMNGYKDGMFQVVERVDNLLYDLGLKRARR